MDKELSIIASLFSIIAAIISIFAYKKSVKNENAIKRLMQQNIMENNKVENSNVAQKNSNNIYLSDDEE